MLPLKSIATEVAHENQLTLAELKSSSRKYHISRARQEAIRRQRDRTGVSYEVLARFWNLHRSAINYAYHAATRRHANGEPLR